MIRTISILTGGSEYAQAAENLAIHLAEAFKARLHLVAAIDTDEMDELAAATNGDRDAAQHLSGQDAERAVEKAEALGITCEKRFHGEGVVDGLVSESRESDLLVVGIPTRTAAKLDDLADEMLHQRLDLVQRSECSLLAVPSPRDGVDPILICYEGGLEGKAALRLGAEIAKTCNAAVYLLPLEDRAERVMQLATSAEKYLEAFELPSVTTLDPDYSKLPESQILAAAGAVDPNLIVLGSKPHNALQRFFGENTAEELTADCEIPVLLAR